MGRKIRGNIRYTRFEGIPGLELYRGIDVTRGVPRHTHGLLSIDIAEAGVRICENRTAKHCITPGGIFISNYGEAHSGTIPPGCGYSSRSLRVAPQLLESLMTHLIGRERAVVYFPCPLIYDEELYSRISGLCGPPARTSSRLTRECLFLAIFAELVNRFSEQGQPLKTGREAEAVQRASRYLQDCWQENVSITELADIAGLSQFYFCRAFERETGVPPHVYQLDIRLTKTLELLSKGQSIAQTAAETGFFDQSHFHRAFKRKFGVTPKQYCDGLSQQPFVADNAVPPLDSGHRGPRSAGHAVCGKQ